MTARKSEITALTKILVSDIEYDTPEDCVRAMIEELDQLRADRLDYVGVMQFGSPGKHMTTAIGPWPGKAGAVRALTKHPAAGMASVLVVCPLQSPQGVEKALEGLDAKPEGKGWQNGDKGFWRKVQEIREGDRTGLIMKDIKVIKT